MCNGPKIHKTEIDLIIKSKTRYYSVGYIVFRNGYAFSYLETRNLKTNRVIVYHEWDSEKYEYPEYQLKRFFKRLKKNDD